MNDRLEIQNTPVRKMGLIFKPHAPELTPVFQDVMQRLNSQKITLLSTKSDFKAPKFVKVVKPRQMAKEVDCVLSLGGDGTILQTARLLAEAPSTPLIGLHLGQLGFLTQIRIEELDQAILSLKEGRYRLKERLLLHVQVIRAKKEKFQAYCLNEVVVHRSDIARIIDLRVKVQGVPLGRIRGDGVIVSTPMGSTGYSLSAGGPIVHPAVKGIIITSLAPHTLTYRPVIIPSQYKIEVVPMDRKQADPLHITLDGQEHFEIQAEDKVCIQQAPHPIRFVDLNRPGRFFKTLQDKLHWRI